MFFLLYIFLSNLHFITADYTSTSSFREVIPNDHIVSLTNFLSKTPNILLRPMSLPTGEPTSLPTGEPTIEFHTPKPVSDKELLIPTGEPTSLPTGEPTIEFHTPKPVSDKELLIPTGEPTSLPTTEPTLEFPTLYPTPNKELLIPTIEPTSLSRSNCSCHYIPRDYVKTITTNTTKIINIITTEVIIVKYTK